LKKHDGIAVGVSPDSGDACPIGSRRPGVRDYAIPAGDPDEDESIPDQADPPRLALQRLAFDLSISQFDLSISPPAKRLKGVAARTLT